MFAESRGERIGVPAPLEGDVFATPEETAVPETTQKTQIPLTSAAAGVVATVLTADGLLHLFWATRAGWWPAHDARTLSLAVLGKDVPFTPPILLPLATALFCGAGVVVARARLGRGHRWG